MCRSDGLIGLSSTRTSASPVPKRGVGISASSNTLFGSPVSRKINAFINSSLIYAFGKQESELVIMKTQLSTAQDNSDKILTAKGAAAMPPKIGYAPVRGLKMYYEVHGDGQPLVLLHGSFMTIELTYGQLIPELSKMRKVIALELQGHGRTADIDRPLTFESMADDVAELLKYLNVESADVFGYSMGGTVALQVAARPPPAVRKLVIASAVFKSDGWSPETRAAIANLKPEFLEPTPIKKECDRLAPDPKHFPQFV